MIGRLSVQQVVALRRHAQPLFDLARKTLQPEDIEETRRAYLGAMERYWRYVVEQLEKLYPDRLFRASRVGIFEEKQLPSLGPLFKKFGPKVTVFLLRFNPITAPLSTFFGGVLEQAGAVLVQERTPEAEDLRVLVPPSEWYPRGILALPPLRNGS